MDKVTAYAKSIADGSPKALDVAVGNALVESAPSYLVTHAHLLAMRGIKNARILGAGHNRYAEYSEWIDTNNNRILAKKLKKSDSTSITRH
jgi:hypothetical protein